MSEENLSTAREIFEQWERGNWSAGADLMHPEVVVSWEEPAQMVRCDGAEEIRRNLAAFLEQWRSYRVRAEEVSAIGEDGVLVQAHQSGVGEASGALVENRVFVIWRFSGDKVVQIHWRFDRADALRAAGLAD